MNLSDNKIMQPTTRSRGYLRMSRNFILQILPDNSNNSQSNWYYFRFHVNPFVDVLRSSLKVSFLGTLSNSIWIRFTFYCTKFMIIWQQIIHRTYGCKNGRNASSKCAAKSYGADSFLQLMQIDGFLLLLLNDVEKCFNYETFILYVYFVFKFVHVNQMFAPLSG